MVSLFQLILIREDKREYRIVDGEESPGWWKGVRSVLGSASWSRSAENSRPSGEPDIARSRKTYQGFYGDMEMKLGGTRNLRPLLGWGFFYLVRS